MDFETNSNSPYSSNCIHIVGAGLAGSECAWQLAQRGYNVVIYEMRQDVMTPAHKSPYFAELVCSNSFGNFGESTAPGQLKWEAAHYPSFILEQAQQNKVPAGMALAVDREKFAQSITNIVSNHPRIRVNKKVVTSINEVPRPTVIATGPLTHGDMAKSLQNHFGREFLYFYDAIAPVIDANTVDMQIVWKADRWDKGSQDYYNCPLNKKEYEIFVEALIESKKVELHDFENIQYFESCLPIEVLAERGKDTLRFGPMKPVGLRYPKTGKTPYAVVQLRQDNQESTAYNIVGFQTKMTYSEQAKVLRLIPGLENVEFLKFGSIHRNLFINTPKCLKPDFSSIHDPLLFFAGQITGVEGYFESTVIGLLVASIIDQKLRGITVSLPPRETAIGSLVHAVTKDVKETFQPTNIHFGLFPPFGGYRSFRNEIKSEKIRRARLAFTQWKKVVKHTQTNLVQIDKSI